MQLERYNGHIEEADFLNLLMVDIAGNIRSVSLPHGYIPTRCFGRVSASTPRITAMRR